MVPVVLVATLLVVQFALAYYARQVLAGAADDGAAAAARAGADANAGAELTRQLVDESAGSLLDSHAAVASTDGDVVTVEASGEVVSLLPFIGTITVRASASATVERFQAQGGGP